MRKAILCIGYRKYVMDAEVATALFEALTGTDMEMFDVDYVKDEKTGKDVRVPYLKEVTDEITLQVITPADYAVASVNRKPK